jgi:rod shape-determining protein MreC
VGALLLVAVALITLDFKSGGQNPAHSIGAAVFGPVERGAGYVTRPVVGEVKALSGGDNGTIARLQAQNDQLRAELSQAQAAAAEDPQLKSLLQLAGRGGYRVVAASVVGAGGSYSDTITIDAGSRDGITANETVVTGSGLVGTVTSAGLMTSTVLLASDANSVVGVRVAGVEGKGRWVGGGEIGAVTGTGSTMAGTGTLRLRLFDANATLKPGDQLVTFGSVNDTPYFPGVPVGVVTAVSSAAGSLTQTAQVRPFVDFTSLGVVGVVVAKPRTDPRDSLLPGKAG